MKNMHLCFNNFVSASRVLKQVYSLNKNEIADDITILAMGANKLPKKEKINDNTHVHRINLISSKLPTTGPYIVKLFCHGCKYLEFFIKSLYYINLKKPEIINAHSLEVLPIAFLAKKALKCKIIYDAHELETEKNGSFGKIKSILKTIEKILIKHVDLTLVVSESIADWYVQEYNIERPTVVLNAPKFRKLKYSNHFRNTFNISDEQTIALYQGGLIHGRGIKAILNAFKKRTDNKVVIVFMGYGPLSDEIKTASKQFKNIYYLPAVPPDIVLEYTSSADIGVSLIENICLSYYYCMPNKLFEYAMAGLPVIVSNMKEMSDIVTKNKMGVVIENFLPDTINKAIDQLLDHNLEEIKNNSYRTAMCNSWEVQEEIMIKSYEKFLDL